MEKLLDFLLLEFLILLQPFYGQLLYINLTYKNKKTFIIEQTLFLNYRVSYTPNNNCNNNEVKFIPLMLLLKLNNL